MQRVTVKSAGLAASLLRAIEVLGDGGLVAYPTETFYAIGARHDNEAALERLFALKGRGGDKSVSLIIGSQADAARLATGISDAARSLMDEHWPGPLTLVLPSAGGLSERITQMGTIALRVPGESFALHLARAAGFAITATSANPAGKPPADNAALVGEYFPEGIDLLVDGGPAPGGRPSTIVDVSGPEPRVLRAGAVRLTPDELGRPGQ